MVDTKLPVTLDATEEMVPEFTKGTLNVPVLNVVPVLIAIVPLLATRLFVPLAIRGTAVSKPLARLLIVPLLRLIVKAEPPTTPWLLIVFERMPAI